jgi:ppGpp synthetase/RelA/SpoT-type nucleotidyltranferase
MNFDDYQNAYIGIYTEFADAVRSIVKDAISTATGLPRLQSSKARGKTATSLKFKLQERSLLDSTCIEDEIKDLAGVRLIFYTNTDVNQFLSSRLIPETFTVYWKETRIHYPTAENEQQRYQAFHYTVSLSDKHAALPEYSKFSGMRCEIQIQTVLNHAWAETYHDMVYKARESPGFGTGTKQALDKRMKKIMDDYLRPAGYDFEKVQQDYERLIQGKELFDRDPIETLDRCDNNNQRHELLSRFADQVIPHYDDIRAEFPQIRRALLDVVRAARGAKRTPIESPFGDFPGKTSQDVTRAVIEILDSLRYVDVEATFRTLSDIFKGERDDKIRQQIIAVIKRLAAYDLRVWEKTGPHVQIVLATLLEGMSEADRSILRPILLSVWGELLGTEMEGASFSADAVALRMAALPVTPEIKLTREKAIHGLIEMFDTSFSDADKREVVSALRAATRLPTRGNYSNELCQEVVHDTQILVESLTERAVGQPYEVLQHLEHTFLFDYRRARQIVDSEQDTFGCKALAGALAKSIERFRDSINADQQFVRYKVLVGFESTFFWQWDNPTFDYNAAEEYRLKQLPLYVNEVSAETAKEWSRLLRRCAATQSIDMATFSIFCSFLQMLSKATPQFVLALLERDDHMARFLPAILAGLMSDSEAGTNEYHHLIDTYLSRDLHLGAIARHCRSAGRHTAQTIKQVLHRAIVTGDVPAACECAAFAIQYHDSERLPLREDIFVPAIKLLISKKDAWWVDTAWVMREGETFFEQLSLEDAELVLTSLLPLNRIDYRAERVLTIIAGHHPASVWAFLERRLTHEKEGEERYEAIPYRFHGLEQALATDVDLAASTLRMSYKSGDYTFRFTGGRLLHAVFPIFTDELALSINKIVARGSEDDYEFAIDLLQNYCGEPATHEVVKELVARLEDDSTLSRLATCLDNTGVVTGEFGMVEAYRRKKDAVSSWLADKRPKIRKYAESYVRSMEQRIASEQRTAEMQSELRKRDYETETK